MPTPGNYNRGSDGMTRVPCNKPRTSRQKREAAAEQPDEGNTVYQVFYDDGEGEKTAFKKPVKTMDTVNKYLEELKSEGYEGFFEAV